MFFWDSHSNFADVLNLSDLLLTFDQDVMFGGTETVASAIEWAMSELMKSPDDMRQLQAELTTTIGLDRKVHETDLDKLPFLKCVVKETLRLHPPIPLLLHETAEDCTVAGYLIPKRSRIMINVFAIGRDKAAWKDADTFRPSRFSDVGDSAGKDFKGNYFEFLPFGSGRRSCPGMHLGLYSLELAVAQLVHCFNWNLPDAMKPDELDMSDIFGLTAPRAVRLSAVPTPRLNCPLC
jgi:ferulate-5-hydroxylase